MPKRQVDIVVEKRELLKTLEEAGNGWYCIKKKVTKDSA
jgi:hypothetical protein